jgi:opacity protein-like surface antigen
MNTIRRKFPSLTNVLLALLLVGSASKAYAADKNCWVEVFEDAQYGGKHQLIEGATELTDLTNVNGNNWNKRIHSLKVGPTAKVTVYQNPGFELTVPQVAKNPDLLHALGATEQDIKEDSELIFIANKNVHDLGDFNFHKKISSLKLECVSP